MGNSRVRFIFNVAETSLENFFRRKITASCADTKGADWDSVRLGNA